MLLFLLQLCSFTHCVVKWNISKLKYFLLLGGSNEFQETDWVNHFSTQKVEISNLEPEVYEFKIVGRNAVGKSPDSDIVEARLEEAPVIEREL